MVAMIQPRLLFAPVVTYIGAENQSHAARLLGIPLRRVHRYVHDGVPCHQADDLAGRANAHPSELWGNALDDALDEVEQRRAHAMTRKLDGNRVRKRVKVGTRQGWSEIDRSWRQWANQRQRFRYDAADRAADEEREAA